MNTYFCQMLRNGQRIFTDRSGAEVGRLPPSPTAAERLRLQDKLMGKEKLL